MVYTHKPILSEFNALAFELRHFEDFQKAEKQYFSPEYEIDSESDCFGSLYRVWDRGLIIGTFCQNKGKWLASAYYQNRCYTRLDKDLDRTFQSNELAINHIIRSYES